MISNKFQAIGDAITDTPPVTADEVDRPASAGRRPARALAVVGAFVVAIAAVAGVAGWASRDQGAQVAASSESDATGDDVATPTSVEPLATSSSFVESLAAASTGAGREIDPVESVADMRERSDVAVCGTVTTVRPGRTYESGGVAFYMAEWVVQSEDVGPLKSQNSSSFVVSVPVAAPSREQADKLVGQLETSLPSGSSCFFLRDLTKEIGSATAVFGFVSPSGFVTWSGASWDTPYTPDSAIEAELERSGTASLEAALR